MHHSIWPENKPQFNKSIITNKCEASVTTGASAIQQSINQSINQSNKQSNNQSIDQSINQSIKRSSHQSINQLMSPVTFQVYPINQSTDCHFTMSFLFGFETFSGFYSFLHVSWYISGIWLDGMREGVGGMREQQSTCSR